MKTTELLEKLKGIHTVESIMKTMDVNRQMAIYYVHRLRKKGYVKPMSGQGIRLYNINPKNRLGGTSHTELLNKNSPVKIAETQVHKIYGKEPTHEELLIYAIKKGTVRYLLSSLAQYKKITDWSRLYQTAKKENLQRQVGALYDIAKKIMKVRRMPERFRNNSLPKKYDRKTYIIPKLFSKDFKKIEERWKVCIPINISDLEEYLYDKHRRPKRSAISNLKRAG